MLKTLSKAFAGAGMIFLLCPAAFAQSSNTQLINRINQLENQVQTLSRQVYRGDGPTPSQPVYHSAQVSSSAPSGAGAAQTEVRLSQLEAKIRELTGRLEEREYEVSQMSTRLDKALQDVEARLTALEHGGAATATSVPSPSAQAPVAQTENVLGSMPPANVPDSAKSTPEGLYEYAFTLLRQSEYEGAAGAFQEFLAQYPDHALAGNAQYWLAETYYVRSDLKNAAKYFAQGYQKYPKGSKAADNLLKLAMSLSRLNKTEDACLTLDQLSKEFPNEAGPVAVRAGQERSRIGCP